MTLASEWTGLPGRGAPPSLHYCVKDEVTWRRDDRCWLCGKPGVAAYVPPERLAPVGGALRTGDAAMSATDLARLRAVYGGGWLVLLDDGAEVHVEAAEAVPAVLRRPGGHFATVVALDRIEAT